MKPQILYHYTDYTSLNGILGSRELRVNNVLNMNDAAEMELFTDGIFEAVVKRLRTEGHEEKAEQMAVLFAEEKSKYYDYSVYAACFSAYRDDASQWERYAYDGKGVCLGVRRDLLEKMTDGVLTLQQVFYRDDMEAHPLVSEFCTLALATDDLTQDNPDMEETVIKVWRNSASFKHPSFSSEHEVRLVIFPFAVEDFAVKARYHVARERIKKYYPLNLDILCTRAGTTLEELVTEIIIGPESTQSPPILKDYLKDIGLPALADKVVRSDCPLRKKI